MSAITGDRGPSGKSSIMAGQFSVNCQLGMIVIERAKERSFSRDYSLFVLADIPCRDTAYRPSEIPAFRGLLNAS